MDHDDPELVLDELDDIECGPGDNRAKATELAARATRSPVGSLRWARFLATAADHLSLAGEHDRALEILGQVERTDADLDPSVDARVLSVLIASGRPEDWEPLERRLRASSREFHLGEDYVWVGEALEEAGHLRMALRWFNMAIRDVDPADHHDLDPFALSGHHRVRRALGLPEDAYDRADVLTRGQAVERLRE